MEDEECLPEYSGLNVYLQNLGYSDVEVAKKMVQNSSNIRFEVSKPDNKRTLVEVIDEDVINQIGIILSSQMLFEEDITYIEKLLSNFEVVKNSILKCMFKDIFGVAIIFLGLCLYWVIGYYAFIIVSSFYAYIAAYYLRRRYYYRSRLKKLSSIIQGNFLLLKKTVKFIEDNKALESKFSDSSISDSKEYLEGFDHYKNFKEDFLLSVSEIINIFIKSTQKLIHKVPLYEYIENPEYYLCNNFKKFDEYVNLSRLYEIYLLLQSEFLKRLILSLIPNLTLSPCDNFNEINKVLSETCLNLLKIKKVINKKFRFIFFHGIHSPKPTIEFKLPKRDGASNNLYMEEFYLNLHEVTLNLQNLLLMCRILEENIKSEKTLDHVENELTEILGKLNSCQRNISDCLIFLSKSNAMTNMRDRVTAQKEKTEDICKSNEVLTKVEVGYSDLDPKVEDEIFEMYLAKEDTNKNLFDRDDWDINENLEKKLKKEYCKNVMKELKVRLIEKAKNWKEREKELLKKKGLIDTTDDLVECESQTTDDDNENELDSNNISLKKTEIFEDMKNNLQNSDNLDEERKKSDLKNHTTVSLNELQSSGNNFLQNCLPENCSNASNVKDGTMLVEETTNFNNFQSPSGMFKTEFFNDLNKARQKIFKSSLAIKEELICDSDESDTS